MALILPEAKISYSVNIEVLFDIIYNTLTIIDKFNGYKPKKTECMDVIQTFPNKLFLRHGLLCLDFTNTVFWRLRDEPREGFKDYTVFINWGLKIGLLTETAANHLIQQSESHPDEATLVLSRAIELREALYRIIVTTVEGNQPNIEDLDLLNREISRMLRRTLLIHGDSRYNWGWRVAENDLDQMLWPILRSATELLTSEEMRRIGVCGGEGCGWLFYDKSRNRSRKWCDMSDCGNRAKARRFYKRKRENNINRAERTHTQ